MIDLPNLGGRCESPQSLPPHSPTRSPSAATGASRLSLRMAHKGKDKDAVRAAYHRGAHWAERVEMAQWWADHLETLRTGAEIVPLASRRGG